MVMKLKINNKNKSFVKKGWAKFGLDSDGNGIYFGIRIGGTRNKDRLKAIHKFDETFKLPTINKTLSKPEIKSLAEKLNIQSEDMGSYMVKIDTTSEKYKEYSKEFEEFGLLIDIVCSINGIDELYYNDETDKFETIWDNLNVPKNDYFALYNYLTEKMEIQIEGFKKAQEEIEMIKEGAETEAEEELKYLEQFQSFEMMEQEDADI